MFRATVRSLLAHKLRFALTAVSVVLGVAFIAGTLVLTDTLNRTFETLFGEANQGTSVAVRAKTAFESNNGATDRELIPASLLPVVQRVQGARAAVGDSDGYTQIVDKAGKVVNNGGAPGLGIAWHDLQELSPLRLQVGRGPAGPGEVAIDAATAKDRGIAVGDQIRVVTRTGVRTETVSGIFKFGTTGNLAGATLAAFDPGTAEKVLGAPGTYTSISVAAEPGVSQTTLAERVRGGLPPGVEAITGEQLSKESSNSIKSALSFFNTFLLVFAGIALFVGSFIIFNTFSMLVAQRTRELALLRALGASRGQVTVSLLGEALTVGVIGSTAGLGLGVLVALGLRALLSAFGTTLPEGGLAFLPHTVLWSYVVGVGVTVVAALLPARRAARIPPIAALLADGRLLVDDRVATDRKWSVGQPVPITFSKAGTQNLILGATYKRNQIAGNYLVRRQPSSRTSAPSSTRRSGSRLTRAGPGWPARRSSGSSRPFPGSACGTRPSTRTSSAARSTASSAWSSCCCCSRS